MKKTRLFIIIVLILFILVLPYRLAAAMAGPDHVFIGFLLNPIDGATYLAKMRIGWSG